MFIYAGSLLEDRGYPTLLLMAEVSDIQHPTDAQEEYDDLFVQTVILLFIILLVTNHYHFND